MFNCEMCGNCCRRIGKTLFAKGMALPDGSCKYLNKETNLCKIYNERPIFCRVDDYYDKFLFNQMTREEFYRKNKEICRKWQNLRRI